MKRLPAREMILLCAPILLSAGAFFILRRAPKDPNAKIALSLTSLPSTLNTKRNAGIAFAWQAKAVGGPKYGYRFGYRQQIVAVTTKGETVVFAEPRGNLVVNSSSMGSSNQTPGKDASISRDTRVDDEHVPLTTKRLEWRGEIVAVPLEEGVISAPAVAAQLQKWATMTGAARVVKTFPIAFDARKNAIKECLLEPVNTTNASKGSDTCITTEVRRAARRVCRRLVAFDGKTKRVLWDDNAGGRNSYWQSSQSTGSMGWERENVLFRLRDVPREWGEIVWLYDVVFVDGKPDHDNQNASLGTIDALERAGGLRLSRRLVVRAKGKTVALPAYQKTPNLQLQSLKIQKFPTGAQIEISMLYVGKRAKPEIDVPGFVEFFDSKGSSVQGLNQSYRVKRGAKTNEWVLAIVLKNPEKAPPKMSLNVEIADEDAAPLRIKRDIVLPK